MSSPEIITDAGVKERVLETAERLFREHLYSAVSTDAIAQELGISKKTLYKHFRSKDEILQSIIERITATINQRLDTIYTDTGCPFITRVRACLDFMCDTHRNMATRSVMLDLQRSAPRVWDWIHQARQKRITNIAAFMGDGMKQGKLRNDLDVDLVSTIYVNVVAHMMDERIIKYTTLSSERLYTIFTTLFYTGLFTDAARETTVSTETLNDILSKLAGKLSDTQMSAADEDERVRNRILDASKILFFQFGFSRVTMDELAQELGVSKKTLYKYFTSKEDLLRAIFQRFSTNAGCMHDALEQENMESYVAGIHGFVEHMSGIMSRISQQFARDLLRNAPHIWDELLDWRRNAIDRMFVELMTAGQRIHAVRMDMTPNEISETYRVVIDSVLHPEMLSSGVYNAATIYRTIIQLMFYGILTTEGRSEYRSMETPLEKELVSNDVASASRGIFRKHQSQRAHQSRRGK